MADASYVRDVDSIWQIIKDHEQETGSKYCVARSPRNFGNIDPGTNKPKKIYWDYSGVIPFCGMPFIILGTKVLDCQHGPDRNLAHKRRFKERCKSRPLMKHRCLKQETKKFNCPAQIRVHEVMMFKDYKITESTKRRKEVQSKALRDALGKGHVRNERRFYVNFPKPSAHTGHEVGQKDDAALDPVLINMIHKMVGVGVSSVTEMRRRLKTFVATKWPTGLPKPAKQDRKYYPSAHTIKKHMYGARVKRTENGTENETDSNGGEKSPTAEEQESDSVFHQSESYRKLDSAEQTAVQILCEGALEHDTVYVISEAVDCIPGATAQMEVREEVVDETQTINAYLNSCNELLVQINSLAHQIVHSSVLERLKHNLEDVKSQLEKDIQTERSVSQLIYQVMP